MNNKKEYIFNLNRDVRKKQYTDYVNLNGVTKKSLSVCEDDKVLPHIGMPLIEVMEFIREHRPSEIDEQVRD